MDNLEINEIDREEIARLIIEGNTSGRLDCDKGISITWELKMDKWKND